MTLHPGPKGRSQCACVADPASGIDRSDEAVAGGGDRAGREPQEPIRGCKALDDQGIASSLDHPQSRLCREFFEFPPDARAREGPQLGGPNGVFMPVRRQLERAKVGFGQGQPTSRRQNPNHLQDHRQWVVEVNQQPLATGCVEDLIGKGKSACVGPHHTAWRTAGLQIDTYCKSLRADLDRTGLYVKAGTTSGVEHALPCPQIQPFQVLLLCSLHRGHESEFCEPLGSSHEASS